jgi:hypothetical protein
MGGPHDGNAHMPAIVRPQQQILFSDRPRGQIQADLLDAQIHNLIEAISSTQQALADIRRDDGKLANNSVGPEQLAAELKHSRKEIDSAEQRIVAAAEKTADAINIVVASGRETDLRATDAEAAAVSAAQMLSAISHGNVNALDSASDAENSADRAESAAIDAKNSANYSTAQADNAIAAKDEALQWAEYLGGPVIDNSHALDFIESSKFPQGLFYQPVSGMGGVGGLWSAKWWAVYCQQLVGNVGFYYLGPWSYQPIPGATNPNTGETVPDPLAVGSFYYDTNLKTVMVWNGTAWQPPGVTVAPGFRARYVYLATDAQVTFRGADINGFAPTFVNEGHDVCLNGVRLVPEIDFTTDTADSSMTLVEAPGAGAVIQWDLMIPPDQINSAQVDAFKVQPLLPDGTNKIFTLSYIDPAASPGTPIPTNIGQGAQLMVSLDGVIQEPGVDFTATGATLSMTIAPLADSRLWAIWFRPHVAVELPP